MDINELESFKLSDAVKFHKELNPQLWEDHKLDPEVRDQLLLIAKDFVEYLGISDLKVKDVTISGSNAAYSYTPHSDLDLHVLVDFNELPNNEVYQELFTAKKTLYNDEHNITVHDVPVELYVQDSNQPVQSLGEYSIVHDKWIRIPKKRRANFDEVATKAKYEKLGDLIELALKTRDPKRVADTIALVKRYRKSGLDKHGEFGPENLAYKAVRKQGLVQALYDLRSELHGEKLSIEEENLSEKINPDILSKDFDVKKKIDLPKVGPLTLHAHYLTNQIAPQFKVNVITPDGKKVGYFRFVVRDYEPNKKIFGFKVKSKLDPYVLGGNVSVWDDYQKKGIATAVYNFVKELGNDIKPSTVQTSAGKAMWKSFDRKTDEDYHPNAKPRGPEFPPTMPAGTVRVDVSDVYDWYKLGQHISNLHGLGKHDFGKGPPSTIMAFGSEPEEHKYIKDLEKTGLTTTDIDPIDKNQPKGMKRQKTDPTYNVNEDQYTFAGKDPMSFKSPNGGTPTMLLVTGQGSRYLVTSDGMVLRNKSFHASTGGEDQGLKDWSGAIEFYDPNEKPGGAPFALTVSKAVEKKLPVALSNTKDGKRALLIHDGKQWRVAKVSDVYNNVASTDDPIVATYSKTPKLNWNVFDYDVDANNRIVRAHPGSPVTHGIKLGQPAQVSEASGYIPSEKEKNDPRFKTALTVDVKPDANKKNAKAFGWKVSRAGIPPQARPDGKIK